MRRVYIFPNLITASGLACGLFVIFKASLAEESSNLYDLLHVGALLLLINGLLDFLDGTIARLLKAESEFGLLFDSLSDAISFGVAPSVLFLKTVDHLGTKVSLLTMITAMIYSLCGVLRLVRYNIIAHEAEKESEENEIAKKTFVGLPIPAAAAAAVSINLVFHMPSVESSLALAPWIQTLVLSVLFLILAYLMISRIRFPALKTLHVQIPTITLLILGSCGALLMLYGFIYFFPFMMMGSSLAYIIIGLTMAAFRYVDEKKTRE